MSILFSARTKLDNVNSPGGQLLRGDPHGSLGGLGGGDGVSVGQTNAHTLSKDDSCRLTGVLDVKIAKSTSGTQGPLLCQS